MTSDFARTAGCAVCGAHADFHGDWFLLVENRWLDRLKILIWDPAMADQIEAQSVCGKEHLRVLVEHWLMREKIDLQEAYESVAGGGRRQAEPGPSTPGALLGELAVDRNPLSHVWTGSAETLECILSALTGEGSWCSTEYPHAPVPASHSEDLFSRQNAAWA